MRSAIPTRVGLLSVSIDLGAGRRGVDMGPSALRIAGLRTAVEALGHEVIEVGTVTAPAPETAPTGESKARYLEEIVEVCRTTQGLVHGVLEEACFPLVLGGDHSISIGSVSAVARYHRERDEAIGLLWVDAHGDMNNPDSTPSGNIHGMVLSILLGRGPEALVNLVGGPGVIDPARVCLLGTRDLDDEEVSIVQASGVRVFTMTEIDDRGAASCIEEALERSIRGTAGFYISFDLDGIDPQLAPGVGTPVPGGLTYREAHLICEKAARSGRLLGLDLVELNPVRDVQNGTARLGVGLIASALGKRIL